MVLLSEGTQNAKTKKNSVKTYILYLSPYTDNSKGINICPKATKECSEACLFNSGYSAIYPFIKERRREKTEFYLSDKDLFLETLAVEIKNVIRKSTNKNEKVLFRLNGTSDLDFLGMMKSKGYFDFESVSDNVLFYDYTKIFGKIKKYKNNKKYTLTFSYSGENIEECKEVLSMGHNVSVVYKDIMPETFLGYKVIDGDKADDLMLNEGGIVLALKLKGHLARKMDLPNFVI
jgi:hypothetical protein